MSGAKIQMYTAGYCGFCRRAEALLRSKGAAWEAIHVDHDADKRLEMVRRSGRRTVPQIWIGDLHVGGYDELSALELDGRLDALLNPDDESTAA